MHEFTIQPGVSFALGDSAKVNVTAGMQGALVSYDNGTYNGNDYYTQSALSRISVFMMALTGTACIVAQGAYYWWNVSEARL